MSSYPTEEYFEPTEPAPPSSSGDLHSFEPTRAEEAWRPRIPERARRELEAKGVVRACHVCGGSKRSGAELGTNEDGLCTCLACYGDGDGGFAWWRDSPWL